MDSKLFLSLLQIVEDKVQLDKRWIWTPVNIDIAFQWLLEEIQEAQIEYKNNKKIFLEDELWDVFWCFLRLVELLHQEEKIDKNNILSRMQKKYSQRVYGIQDGKSWNEIKKVQKEQLIQEQNILDSNF